MTKKLNIDVVYSTNAEMAVADEGIAMEALTFYLELVNERQDSLSIGFFSIDSNNQLFAQIDKDLEKNSRYKKLFESIVKNKFLTEIYSERTDEIIFNNGESFHVLPNTDKNSSNSPWKKAKEFIYNHNLVVIPADPDIEYTYSKK